MKRQSGIELLRLVSMLMVLNVHTFIISDPVSWETISWFTIVDFFREATSISCVNLFVLISGYFGIKWKSKSIFSLVYQVAFFVFLIFFLMWGIGLIHPSAKTILQRLNFLYLSYWFIPSYLGLYLLSPILNAYCEKCNRKELLTFIVLFYVLQSYYQLLNSPDFNAGYSILSFCGLYLIGRFLRQCDLDSVRLDVLWVILVLSTIIITFLPLISMIYLPIDGIKIKTFSLLGFGYNSPFVLVQSIVIFILFARLKFKNKVINYLASSALAIYLLHMHPDLKVYFCDYVKGLYATPPHYQAITLIMLFITIAIVAIVIDYFRKITSDYIYDKVFYKVGRKTKKCVVKPIVYIRSCLKI